MCNINKTNLFIKNKQIVLTQQSQHTKIPNIKQHIVATTNKGVALTSLQTMKELSLQYNRGSEPNTIDVCVSNGLFLGKIVLAGMFGINTGLQFQQATKLNEADKQEIGFVMQSIQNVL